MEGDSYLTKFRGAPRLKLINKPDIDGETALSAAIQLKQS